MYDNLPATLTVDELRKTLRIGRNQAYNLVKRGKIQSFHFGRSIRIPRSAVLDFLEGAQAS